MKYLVAGVILLLMTVLPLAGYALYRVLLPASKPTAVARTESSIDPGAQQGQPVVLTGTVVLNDAVQGKADDSAVPKASASNGTNSPFTMFTPDQAGTSSPTQTPMPPRAAETDLLQSPPVKSSGVVAMDSAEVASPAGAPPADTTALIRQIEPSVVVVQVTLEKGSGIGSGFPLDNQGTIVTNYHVIEGAKSVKIKFGEKTVDVQGFLVLSPGKDIAILKANLGAEKLTPLKLAAMTPSKGETVLTFGAPLGFDSTVSNGIVSSVRKGSDLREIFKKLAGSDVYVDEQHYDLDAVWVQTTAPISGGNSGGPLVNLKGEVVGLNTWHLVSGQNMNFAISADHISQMLRSAQSGVHSLTELPKARKQSSVAGNARRTLEYWDEVSRINRGLATRLRKIKQPPLPSNRQQLAALFPKLAGIYKKLGEMLPEAGEKLKALKIDDVDSELVALVTVDAIALEKIGGAARDMSADAKLFRADKVTLYDAESLSKKAFGKFEDLEIGAAYDVLRIRLTNRYGLTFANLFDAARGKSTGKSTDDDMNDDSDGDSTDSIAGADPQREKQAAGKLRLAKQLKQAGKNEPARERLQQIVKDFAGTEAAAEAQTLLDELGSK